MKRNIIIGILFFSALWGISEAFIGNVFYGYNIPFASVLLTIIAFVVLTVARNRLPFPVVATMIGALAMLFKFLNAPFFACHLLGIFMLGLSYDLFFSTKFLKNIFLKTIAAVYTSYAIFALTITFVFRYEHWLNGSTPKIIHHIFVNGSIAAIGCAIFVPLTIHLLTKPEGISVASLSRKKALFAAMSLITLSLWLFSLGSYLLA